jgi:hypothetical protein
MLKSTMMNTMLANDFQALLFNYINNILVGGTPCLTYGTMVDKQCLYFVFLCDGSNTIFYNSFVSDHG